MSIDIPTGEDHAVATTPPGGVGRGQLALPLEVDTGTTYSDRRHRWLTMRGLLFVRPAAAEFGGRTRRGIAGSAAAGALWGSFVGPEGSLIAGFLGGIAGAFGGDRAVKWALGK